MDGPVSAEVISLTVDEMLKEARDIATIPGRILPKLWTHPLINKGINQFLEDWKVMSK